MAPDEQLDGIDWDEVKSTLPSSDHDLLDSIRSASEARSEDLASAVNKAVRTDLGLIRSRFQELGGVVQ